MQKTNMITWVRKQDIFIRLVTYYVSIIVFYIIILLLDYRLAINSKDFIDSFIWLFIVLGFCYILFPELSHILKYDFVKSPSIKVILFPIILSPVLNIIISLVRFIPTIYGESIIPIGKNQSIINYPSFTFQLFLYVGLLPALTEELLFRFIGFQGLKVFIEKIISVDDSGSTYEYRNKMHSIWLKAILLIPYIFFQIMKYLYDRLFVKKDKIMLLMWTIISSSIFSLAHGPNIMNFYLYFIPGVLFAFLYLKYGLLSSITAHCIGNYLAPITCTLSIYFFKMLFPQIML